MIGGGDMIADDYIADLWRSIRYAQHTYFSNACTGQNLINECYGKIHALYYLGHIDGDQYNAFCFATIYFLNSCGRDGRIT